MIRQGQLTGIDHHQAVKNFVKAVNKGVLKVMSKMGISTVQSYCGAQIFEAVGANKDVVDKDFTWTAPPGRRGGLPVIPPAPPPPPPPPPPHPPQHAPTLYPGRP